MKRRPDWRSGVGSGAQFSGYSGGGGRGARSLSSSRSRRSSSSPLKRGPTRRADGKETEEKPGLSGWLWRDANANATRNMAGWECLLTG